MSPFRSRPPSLPYQGNLNSNEVCPSYQEGKTLALNLAKFEAALCNTSRAILGVLLQWFSRWLVDGAPLGVSLGVGSVAGWEGGAFPAFIGVVGGRVVERRKPRRSRCVGQCLGSARAGPG